MNTADLRVLHRRIRQAQLPGYALHYNEGSDSFSIVLFGHDGGQVESREHSWDILIDWAQEQLSKWGA